MGGHMLTFLTNDFHDLMILPQTLDLDLNIGKS